MSVYIYGVSLPAGGCLNIQLWPDGRVVELKGLEVGKAINVPNDHGALSDLDALKSDIEKRCCADCEKRKGKNKRGKYGFIYEIGEAPCRSCEVDDMKDELDNAPVIIPAERSVPICPLHSDNEVMEYCVEGPCADWLEGRCPIMERRKSDG